MVKFKSINKMMEDHVKGMEKVHQFLIEHGADTWHDHYQDRGNVMIRVCHSNNYIECGPHDEDPDDILWYAWTQEDYDFKVPFAKLQGMLQALKGHQSISKERIAPNIRIETDITNQFTMHKRIHNADYGLEKITLTIEFRVYHHEINWEEVYE